MFINVWSDPHAMAKQLISHWKKFTSARSASLGVLQDAATAEQATDYQGVWLQCSLTIWL